MQNSKIKATKLLNSAIAFQNSNVEPLRVKDTFESLEDVLMCMNNVLWCDAHHSYDNPVDPPDDCVNYTIDMNGENPGIVAETRPKIVSYRMAVSDAVPYETFDEPSHTEEMIHNPVARAKGSSAEKVKEKALKKLQRQAVRDELKDEETIEKRELKKSQKEKLQNETPEEKKERLAEQRRKREEKKREKAEEKKEKADDEEEKVKGAKETIEEDEDHQDEMCEDIGENKGNE